MLMRNLQVISGVKKKDEEKFSFCVLFRFFFFLGLFLGFSAREDDALYIHSAQEIKLFMGKKSIFVLFRNFQKTKKWG